MRSVFCLCILLATGVTACDGGSDSSQGGQPPANSNAQSESPEYQAHLEQERRTNELTNAAMAAFRRIVNEERASPEEELEAFRTSLRDRNVPAIVGELTDQIVEKQRDATLTLTEIHEFCDRKLDEAEAAHPGFRAGLIEDPAIFACVTTDVQRRMNEVRKAVVCQVLEESDGCMKTLTADEEALAKRMITAAGGDHASQQ